MYRYMHTFSLLKCLSQICLKSKWVELKQGVGEKNPSKNFVQPSKFFKSELMNSISQLPNHAPSKIGSLFWFRKKKCWTFKERRRKAFATLPCLPPSPPSDHSISPSFFFIRSVSFLLLSFPPYNSTTTKLTKSDFPRRTLLNISKR